MIFAQCQNVFPLFTDVCVYDFSISKFIHREATFLEAESFSSPFFLVRCVGPKLNGLINLPVLTFFLLAYYLKISCDRTFPYSEVMRKTKGTYLKIEEKSSEVNIFARKILPKNLKKVKLLFSFSSSSTPFSK